MTEETERRLEWIQANLGTTRDWSREDYREFYHRDVAFLLGEVKSLRRENEELRSVLDEIAERARHPAARAAETVAT